MEVTKDLYAEQFWGALSGPIQFQTERAVGAPKNPVEHRLMGRRSSSRWWRLFRRSMANIDASYSRATKPTFEIIQGELMGKDTTPIEVH
jgi:hypothetical protein